jgi:chromosome segregation ATPase
MDEALRAVSDALAEARAELAARCARLEAARLTQERRAARDIGALNAALAAWRQAAGAQDPEVLEAALTRSESAARDAERMAQAHKARISDLELADGQHAAELAAVRAQLAGTAAEAERMEQAVNDRERQLEQVREELASYRKVSRLVALENDNSALRREVQALRALKPAGAGAGAGASSDAATVGDAATVVDGATVGDVTIPIVLLKKAKKKLRPAEAAEAAEGGEGGDRIATTST